MEKEKTNRFPKSRLRDCIALGILCYCFVRTQDIILSFMVYFVYLMWSVIPIMFYEDYLRRKEIKNDHKEA